MFPIIRPAPTVFSPYQLSPVFWIDATDPSNNGSQPADGTALSSWVDKSQSGLTAIQNTGAEQPTFETLIQNGKPGILASDSGSDLVAPSSSSLNMQAGISVICVLNGNGHTTAQQIPIRYGIFAPAGVTWDWSLDFDGLTGKVSFNGINTLNGAQTSGWSPGNYINTPIIAMGQYDGTNLKIFVNNTEVNSAAVSGTLKSGTNNGLTVMWGPGGNQFTGYIFETLVFQGATTAQLNTLQRTYLGPKWGISVA